MMADNSLRVVALSAAVPGSPVASACAAALYSCLEVSPPKECRLASCVAMWPAGRIRNILSQ